MKSLPPARLRKAMRCGPIMHGTHHGEPGLYGPSNCLCPRSLIVPNSPLPVTPRLEAKPFSTGLLWPQPSLAFRSDDGPTLAHHTARDPRGKPLAGPGFQFQTGRPNSSARERTPSPPGQGLGQRRLCPKRPIHAPAERLRPRMGPPLASAPSLYGPAQPANASQGACHNQQGPRPSLSEPGGSWGGPCGRSSIT
jgi:hypothetical protein